MLIEIFKRSATSADVFTKSDQFANVYAFDIKERYIVMQLDSVIWKQDIFDLQNKLNTEYT